MKQIYTKILVVLVFAYFGSLQAQEVPYNLFKEDVPYKHERELQFLAFYINQGVTSNFYPQNQLLKGQVIGRLFGKNTSNTSDSLITGYVEQRIIPFFIYQPKLFNGRALLRASFEIDWTWGDAAYGTGGNFGSAISSDQVNLQTQNIELEFLPATGWYINLGLQRMYDSPYNPYRTYFDKMTESGYRLMYWGTDGVGITVRQNADLYQWKAGFYQLYELQIEGNDDVQLFEANFESAVSRNWRLGGSVYYVRDRGNGAGGVSIFGQGLNATLLNAYNGTFKFNFGPTAYKADIFWLGTYFSRNVDLMLDRYTLTGFVNYNYGKTRLEKEEAVWDSGPTIGGLGANLRFVYRHGQTANDIFSLDAIYTTGDPDGLDDDHYSGVLTGNMWGTPGGFYISSGAYLMFPHLNVVNRFTPVVGDISNMGYGLTGLTFTAKKDWIPHKFNTKIGTAFAMSNVAPKDGGTMLGNEFNAALAYNFGPFMSLELHGAYMRLGDFFDSNDNSYSADVNGDYNDERPIDPWTAFIVFKWLMF